jgi:hypothetical protein
MSTAVNEQAQSHPGGETVTPVEPLTRPSMPGRRLTRMVRAVVLVALLASGLSLSSAAPASAWSHGNVWINFSSGMCTGGGQVVGIHWAVDNVSSGPAGGDWGDNVIYPTVRIGAQSTISFTLHCKRWGWNTYRAGTGQRVLSPYRSGLSYTYYSYY